jgi:16S rRNA (cytosine967-C5)-methyltransferase
MRLSGRLQAAIEVLDEVLNRKNPASEALRDWGKAHRFAGSTDRHAIGTLVYDGLRTRNSSAAQGGGGTARAICLGVLRNQWGHSVDEIAVLCQGEHGPGALTAAERVSLSAALQNLPPHVAGDFPEWMMPLFSNVFGDNAALELAALAKRAPIDLRVNSLKATHAEVLKKLARFGAVQGPLSPLAIRIAAPGQDQKHVSVEAEPAHGMGLFEVQDAASQVAALLSGASPGETIADVCAGAGGKTLAIAAMMQNKGKIVAHDQDRRRLRPIFERLMRAGVTCVDVLAAETGIPAGQLFDRVIIDAPCTGTGAWRRKPDAKWKLTRKTLDQRTSDQREVLKSSAVMVRPGGHLIYITCSILPEENSEQVKAFLAANREYKIIPYAEQWSKTIGGEEPRSADGSKDTLLLTPRQHDVDGFFVAVMQKKS